MGNPQIKGQSAQVLPKPEDLHLVSRSLRLASYKLRCVLYCGNARHSCPTCYLTVHYVSVSWF